MFKEYDKLFIICNTDIEKELFNLFCQNIMKELDSIDSFFNLNYEKLTINLVSKETLDTVVKSKSIQYKNIPVPNWLVGFSNFQETWVKIPTSDTINEIYKVALHEIVHLLSYKLDTSNRRLKILDEGIAVFLSKQYEGKILTPWVNLYKQNKIPRVSDFCTYDSVEFANKNGYQLSFLIIEFLIDKYGKNTFLQWLQDSQLFMQNISEIDILFHDYITKKIEARIN